MAGQTLRILTRTDYDASGLGAGASSTIVVARKLDTSRWQAGVILARLHSTTVFPAGATVAVLIAPDGFTDDDPGAAWNVTTATLITFTQGTDTPPVVKNAALSAPFGPLAQIQLKFTTGAGGGSFKPSISIDLNLKGE